MNDGMRRINQFFQLASAHAEAEGMDAQVMLGQALLLGLAVCGDRLVWKRPDREAPQIAKASVTWLGTTGELPLWYHRYIEPVREWDDRAQQAFKSTLQKHVVEKPRKRRRLERSLGKWIPEAFAVQKSDVEDYQQKPTAFLVTPKWRATKQKATAGVFGRDRLMLLVGSRDYRDLMKSSVSAAQLRSAAVNRRGGLRVAVNGWCESKAFIKLMRQMDPMEAGVFGWFLPATRPYAIPSGEWVKAKLVGAILHESLKLRFSLPLDPYCPAPEVAERLSAADDGWKAPRWFQDPSIEAQLRGEEDLAWQLAAQLANIHGQLVSGSEEEQELADRAVDLAKWIRWSHACQLRMIYPGPQGEPLEPISCRIVDQLATSPRSARELVRGFHSIPTGTVKAQLDRMVGEGWVTMVGKRCYKLTFE